MHPSQTIRDDFVVYSLQQRGNRNVPIKFLKAAQWLTINDNTGYWVLDKKDQIYLPVEFNFENQYWVSIVWKEKQGIYNAYEIADTELGLDIPFEEHCERHEWGPLDGQPQSDTEEVQNDSEEEAEDIDVKIPQTTTELLEEAKLANLAANIPTISRPRSRGTSYRVPTFTSAMTTLTSTIMPSQSILSKAKQGVFGGPPGRIPPSGGFPSGGGPPGGGPPFGGGYPGRAGGFPSGGGPPGPPGGGPHGPPGGGPLPRGADNKLVGKEPFIFNGDRGKTEEFLLEWFIYMSLNHETPVMIQPLTRATLFLSFIKGADVFEWVQAYIQWLLDQVTTQGRRPTEEFLFDTVMRAFKDAYTDTTSMQKAKTELHKLRMEKGNVDDYITKFEKLVRLAGYSLTEPTIIERFGDGLPPKLLATVITQDSPTTWQEWTNAVIRRQQQYLFLQERLSSNKGQLNTRTNPPRTQQQWKQAFTKKDPNAMDTTPGRVRARQITADDKVRLMKEGKCFRCFKTGHLSRDCPTKSNQPNPPRARIAQTKPTNRFAQLTEVEDDEEEVELNAASTSTHKYSADELIAMITNADDDAKDTVIQKVFMNKDF